MVSDANPGPAETPHAPAQSLPLHERIFNAGIVILIAGLIAAALIYAFSAEDTGPSAAARIASSRGYEFQIERIGGKAAVYAARFNQWLGSLWQGRQLAYTVGVLSIVIALGCFWGASLVSARSPNDRNEGGKS